MFLQFFVQIKNIFRHKRFSPHMYLQLKQPLQTTMPSFNLLHNYWYFIS